MATVLESNKAKIAKRVIEVFEFFDGDNRHATVMDIVRRYGRPQSSTSELLASLVDMGLLYKDVRSRTYTPTPRLATLGSWAQPEIIRSGQLFAFMDRLTRSSRHSVALFGMVGTHVQIFRWTPGAHALDAPVECGMSIPLAASAAGQLLLSVQSTDEVGRVLRRLNSEARADERFNASAMAEQIQSHRRQGQATGEAGFGTDARLTAVLLPRFEGERPLAIGLVYPRDSAIDADALAATLRHGLDGCRSDQPGESTPTVAPLMRAV